LSRRIENPAAIDDVPIGGAAIRRGQFLKFAGLLDSGGNVKEAVVNGHVIVIREADVGAAARGWSMLTASREDHRDCRHRSRPAREAG
jgi:hypothetical protein